VLRFAFFVLLCASTAGFAQDTSTDKATPAAPSAAPQPAIEQVASAEADLAKSNWKAAQARLESWLAAHPNDARALFDAGYVADAQNRLDDAASLYRRAVVANPQSFLAHLSLGLLLARQNHFEEARTELDAATKLDPGDDGPAMKARAWRALALIDRASDATEASNDLLEALKLTPETPEDPESAAASAGLAHVLIARKQYPEAETLLRAALEHSPNDAALTAQLAAILAAQDKAEALPLIQKLHDAHPADAAITRILAEVLATAGDAAGSDVLYARLLAASPKDPALLVGHGQNLIRELKYAQAFAAFNQATQLDPADPAGWSGLAFAAIRTNQPAVTLHALTMRSKYLPEVPSTYFLWATAYDTLNNKKEAATYYHHFLDSSAGKFPDQELQARQRIKLLENK